MSAQQAGLDYLTSYSGILKVIEQVLSIAIISFLVICGYEMKTYFLNGVAIAALLCTAILLFLHVMGVVLKTLLPWFWIECIYALLIGVLYVLASSVVLSILTKGFVVTGLVGYSLGLIYFLDTIDKYQLAVTPRSKYVWNVPDMPEEIE